MFKRLPLAVIVILLSSSTWAQEKESKLKLYTVEEDDVFENTVPDTLVLKSSLYSDAVAEATDEGFEQMRKDGKVMLLEKGDQLKVLGVVIHAHSTVAACSVTRKGKDLGKWIVNESTLADPDNVKKIGGKEIKPETVQNDSGITNPGFSADYKARIAKEKVEAKAKADQEQKAAVEKAKWRTWTDSTGKHTIEAKFRGMAAGKVRLNKHDGNTIQLPFEKLSDEDQKWIESRKK